MAKAALNVLGKVIAEQYGAAGVRAITISPGPVSTGVWTDPDGFIALVAERQGMDPEAFAKQLLGTLGAATGRITTPEEVASVVAFAAAPNNLTGTEIILDGGTVKAEDTHTHIPTSERRRHRSPNGLFGRVSSPAFQQGPGV